MHTYVDNTTYIVQHHYQQNPSHDLLPHAKNHIPSKDERDLNRPPQHIPTLSTITLTGNHAVSK